MCDSYPFDLPLTGLSTEAGAEDNNRNYHYKPKQRGGVELESHFKLGQCFPHVTHPEWSTDRKQINQKLAETGAHPCD